MSLRSANDSARAYSRAALEHPGRYSIRCLGERGVSCAPTAQRTNGRLVRIAKNRIAEEPKEYYQACTTGELPPQLLTLSKKLDEELLKKQEHSAVA
jgi:hypothetical protein